MKVVYFPPTSGWNGKVQDASELEEAWNGGHAGEGEALSRRVGSGKVMK